MAAPLLHGTATLAVGAAEGNNRIGRVVNLHALPVCATGGVVARSGISGQAGDNGVRVGLNPAGMHDGQLTDPGCLPGRSCHSWRRGRSFCRHLTVSASVLIVVGTGERLTEAVPVGIGAAGHGSSEEGNGGELHFVC